MEREHVAALEHRTEEGRRAYSWCAPQGEHRHRGNVSPGPRGPPKPPGRGNRRVRGGLRGHAIPEAVSEKVEVAGVTGGFFDHVNEDPPQVHRTHTERGHRRNLTERVA